MCAHPSHFSFLLVPSVFLQYYSMGNQNRKLSTPNDSHHDHIQILKWRSNPLYNSHIARTFLLSQAQTRSRAFQKVITNQLSNHPFIDLRKFQHTPQASTQGQEIMVFEDFVGELSLVEGWLEMEENLYVLMALLFGYEQIYKKLGWACVHQRCCHITPSGEVRAWINSNPASCVPDLQLIKDNDRKGLSDQGKPRKIYCKTEASICKSILAMAHRLSNQNQPFIRFHSEVSIFAKSNMLQNMNFNSIRTFINGYAFRYKFTIGSDITNAIRRTRKQAKSQSILRDNSLSTLQFKKSHHKSHLSQQFSLKSGKIELPLDGGHSASNIQQRVSQLHFEASQMSHQQPKKSMNTSKKSIKHMNMSIQTSQMMDFQDYSSCDSTKLDCPKKPKCLPNSNQLICSEIIATKETDQKQKENKAHISRLYHFQKENYRKTSQAMNIDEEQSEDKQVIVKPLPNNSRKLVRFHSHNPSFDEDEFNSVHFNKVIPEKSEDHCTHHSLTQTKNNLHIRHESIFAQSPLNRSQFSHSQTSNRDGQSGAMTRVVSGLISNNQIDLCESLGSFQSFQNSQNSDYSGVLLGMGRSVVIVNDSSKQRSSNNASPWRGASHHMTPHLTF